MIDKGITRQTLENIAAKKGKPFKVSEVSSKGNEASSRMAVRRFVEKGLVKKIGPARYQATIKDENIISTYYGGIPIPEVELKKAANGEHNGVRIIPYGGPNTVLIIIEGMTYLGREVVVLPKGGI